MMPYPQLIQPIMWTIALPISVPIPTKKEPNGKFYLNLNVYRNAHYHTLNKAKILFKETVAPLIKHLPELQQVSLSYELYIGTNRETDVANVCSIVDKFFSDALVELGHLPDDNFKHVLGTQYLWGGVDKGKPRVEVTINPITD